jgi:hypothetical protein
MKISDIVLTAIVSDIVLTAIVSDTIILLVSTFMTHILATELPFTCFHSRIFDIY